MVSGLPDSSYICPRVGSGLPVPYLVDRRETTHSTSVGPLPFPSVVGFSRHTCGGILPFLMILDSVLDPKSTVTPYVKWEVTPPPNP